MPIDKRAPRRGARIAGRALGLGLLVLAGGARADAEDTLSWLAGMMVRHEDNLFRLPAGADTLALLGKDTRADDITIASLGFRLDKKFALQRVELESTLNLYRYRNFRYLDFDGKDYRGTWHWHLTPRLGGKLTADGRQLQANFADNQNYSSVNTRTTRNLRFDVDWRLLGGWYLTGGVAENRSVNSQEFRAEDSSRYRPVEVGAKYVAESGAAVTVGHRHGTGQFPGRELDSATLLDTGFRQAESELLLRWPVSGRSTLDGRLTHVTRRHDHFSERDYSGNAGLLGYSWSPTGKLKFAVEARRDLGSFQTSYASYQVYDSLVVAPTWQMDAKLALRGRVEGGRRDFRGGVANDAASRLDRMRAAELTLDWTPLRTLVVSAALKQERRTSSLAELDYRVNSASLLFQFQI